MISFSQLLLFTAASLLATALGAGEKIKAQLGPWGRLEYEALYLEPPDSVLENYPMPTLQPRWCFAGKSADETDAFLNACGVSADVVQRLIADPRAAVSEEKAFMVFPSPEEIEGLTPAARVAVYAELAKSPLNPFHAEPITIPDGDVDRWLAGTRLTEEAAGIIRRLAYRDGDALRFSDLRTLLSRSRNEAEARLVLKTILRSRTLVVTLHVDATDDLPALQRYWSAENRRPDSASFLAAAASPPGGSTIDITHLLPPFARRLVHSYVTPELLTTGQVPNCHWTSLNFFNYTRQNIYMDLRIAASRLLAGYELAKEPYRFGDMIVFIDEEGNAPHTCIYLADDLVFTKNGANSVVPWVISRLGDVRSVYQRIASRTVVYRRVWEN